MKYLIVGLGNPGDKYEETRHNVGFKTLDALAKASNVVFTPDKLAHKASIKHRGRTLILIKPQTFMNLSGKAVNYWLQKEKIGIDNLLVVTDDLALPFGKLRLKPKGGNGGHNGLKDIEQVLNSSKYPRLRFGIGDTFSRGQQVDYVLGEWNEEEKQQLPDLIERAKDIILSFSHQGIQQTMNRFN